MSKFIVWVGNDEVLVTTKNLERDAIKQWFTDGGRDIEEYDRKETLPGETAVGITSRMRVL